MSATNNPLSSLSKEQLDALLEFVRRQTKPSQDPTPTPNIEQPSAPAHSYYYILLGAYETVVDGRDVDNNENLAYEYATTSHLQAWYRNFNANEDIDVPVVRIWTRNEYIDWLRR